MSDDTHFGTSQTILTWETTVTGSSLNRKQKMRVRVMITNILSKTLKINRFFPYVPDSTVTKISDLLSYTNLHMRKHFIQ